MATAVTRVDTTVIISTRVDMDTGKHIGGCSEIIERKKNTGIKGTFFHYYKTVFGHTVLYFEISVE
jgi:hypothetical protein